MTEENCHIDFLIFFYLISFLDESADTFKIKIKLGLKPFKIYLCISFINFNLTPLPKTW